MVDARGPCRTGARKWRTRARLGSRALTLWRVAIVDGCGRMAGSKVVPMMHSGELLRTDADRVRELVEQATTAWREEALQFHHAFNSTRLDRERAIAAALVSLQPSIFQPGLFDRRAERAWLAIAAAERDGALDAAARIATLERAAAADVVPALLLLALVP